MKCPTCHTELDPGARFCAECGQALSPPLSRPSPSVSSMGVAPQRARRRYVWVWGMIAGIAILGGLGFMGYQMFSEERAYERSLETRTPEQRFLIRAQNGETEEVKSLLATGMNPNTKDGATGVTALILAGVGGHADTVKALIDAGADVNGQDMSGSTALIAAAHLGRIDAVKVLIAAGANVNAQLNSGDTALKIAREAGHTELVRVLQEAGATE